MSARWGVKRLAQLLNGAAAEPSAPTASTFPSHASCRLTPSAGAFEIGGVPGVVGQLQLFQAVQALGETARVAALGLGQRLEPLGDLREALLAGGPGHAGVHLRVLVGLALDGRLEVLLRVAEG